MQKHDRFEELCALEASGLLSPGECEEFLAHQESCDRCKRAGDDFALILEQLLPIEYGDVSNDFNDLLGDTSRATFFSRASAAGIRFSPEARRLPRSFFRRAVRVKWYLAIAAACGLLAATISEKQKWTEFRLFNAVPVNSSNVANNTSPDARFEVEGKSRVVEQPSSSPPLVTDSATDLAREIHLLQRQLAQASIEKQRALAEAEHLQAELGLRETKSTEDEQTISRQKSDLQKLTLDQSELVAALDSKETTVRQLSEDMAAQKARSERERQLKAAAGNLSDIMGARNLHIIDVYDYDGAKRQKSFGRVFYTEHNSLLFYAFDLAEKDSASKVTFQAWGQRDGGNSGIRNLGAFRLDDHEQKRWVLRLDDPKLLSSIDSLFVTVEPNPGRQQPSGKRMLYAVLSTTANHP